MGKVTFRIGRYPNLSTWFYLCLLWLTWMSVRTFIENGLHTLLHHNNHRRAARPLTISPLLSIGTSKKLWKPEINFLRMEIWILTATYICLSCNLWTQWSLDDAALMSSKLIAPHYLHHDEMEGYGERPISNLCMLFEILFTSYGVIPLESYWIGSNRVQIIYSIGSYWKIDTLLIGFDE